MSIKSSSQSQCMLYAAALFNQVAGQGCTFDPGGIKRVGSFHEAARLSPLRRYCLAFRLRERSAGK
jgi:hypothetical protein